MKRKEIFVCVVTKYIRDSTEGGDPFEIEFAAAEVEFAELDKEMWNRRKGQAEYELQAFLDYVKDKGLTKQDLLDAVEWDEEDERKYWIARLGKQPL